jgi:hypothetical protein
MIQQSSSLTWAEKPMSNTQMLTTALLIFTYTWTQQGASQ